MSERKVAPTVYGIEDEQSVLLVYPGDVTHELVGSCHTADTQLNLYQEPKHRGSIGITQGALTEAVQAIGLEITSDGLLSNGGRLYSDPSGPEYAGPEVLTAAEAVYRSFDGDDITLAVLNELRNKGVITSFQCNRRNVDHNRSSRSVHLNTATTLAAPSRNTSMWFAALNVAKGAIFGSGGLLLDAKGETAYHHSPRLSLTTHRVAHYAQYTYRPLVRAPFKEDGPGLYRMETVTSDALNFAWPLRASLVITNALRTLIELGYGSNSRLPRLTNPITAARRVGQYGNECFITTFNKQTNAKVRPVDLLKQICEVVLEVDDAERYLDKESAQVIPEIIDVADRISTDMYSVTNQVESVTRLVAMQRKMKRDNLTLGSETMCRFDYAWDVCGGGIAERLRNKGLAGWQGFDTTRSVIAAKKRRLTPPQDTRAKVRGALIKSSQGRNASNWSRLDVDNRGSLHYFPPLATEIPAHYND